MAPRRQKQNIKSEVNYENLTLDKVLCPICRSILIDPVTLPCGHHFCLDCFDKSVNNAALSCPLCRTRISSWLRSARKEKKLINVVLWDVIQRQYHKYVVDKRSGIETNVDENYITPIILSTPGEINQEYKNELEKEQSEIMREREKEEKASEQLIKQLQEDEERKARELEMKLKRDEEIALQLTRQEAELAKSQQGCSKNTFVSKITPRRGPLDLYVVSAEKMQANKSSHKLNCAVKCDKISVDHKTNIQEMNIYKPKVLFPNTVSSTEKQKFLLDETVRKIAATQNTEIEDIINKEFSHFKPIAIIPRTPPKRDKYGKIILSPIIQSKALKVKDSGTPRFRVKSPYQQISPNSNQHMSAFKSTLTERKNANVENIAANSSCTENEIDSKQTRTKAIKKISFDNCTETNSNPKSCLHRDFDSTDAESSLGSPFLGFSNQDMNSPINFPIMDNNNIFLNNEKENDDFTSETDQKPVAKCKITENEIDSTSEADILLQQKLLEESILQEKRDFELAQKLQAEFDQEEPRYYQLRNDRHSAGHNSKSHIFVQSTPRKRQSTLNEMCSRKKYKV